MVHSAEDSISNRSKNTSSNAGGYNSGNPGPTPGSGKSDPATCVLPIVGVTSSGSSSGTTNSAIEKIFDPEKIKKQQELAGLIGDVGNQAIGLIGQKMDLKEGGKEKIALHALVGFIQGQAGGANGLLTGAVAGATEAIGTLVAAYLQQHTELSPSECNAIQQWSAAMTGGLLGTALAGNTAGGLPVAAAVRITAIIDLAGGWDAFVKRTKEELAGSEK